MRAASSQSTGPTSAAGATFARFRQSRRLLGGAISSAAASPAKISASRGVVPALAGADPACGANTPGFFASFDLDSSSWRTPQLSLFAASEEFSATWPRSGMTRNGTASLLSPSVPLISVRGLSSLPTPLAMDSAGGTLDNRNANTKRWDGLNSLKAMAKAGRLTKHGLLTTPCADDTGARSGEYSQGGIALSAQVGGPLNPEFVEWLMGFPTGWTDVGASATL